MLNKFQRILIAFAVSQIIPTSSFAAIIEVNSISDTRVVNGCTLRDAIIAAETDAIVAACTAGNGTDTIDLTGLPDNSTIIISSRLPDISSSISINGRGPDMLSISGSAQTAFIDSGILNITEDGELNLSSLTLTLTPDTAIRARFAALTLNSVSITNNSAFFGGAIDSSNSSISIFNSTLSNNSAVGNGGAINSNDSDIVISNSTLSENFITGQPNLFGIELTGGGIRSNNDSLLIRNSILSGNSALVSGGAIGSFSGSITIENSTLVNNSARSGGAINADRGTININKRSLTQNNASAGNGGGIISFSAFLNINNSTLSGNSASMNGGGMSTSFSSITINHSTITENIADNIGSGIATSDISLIVSNSIISGNNSSSVPEGAEVFAQGAITTINNILGFNQLSNFSAFAGFLPDATNIVATSDEQNIALDQIINPLADNGGNNFTHSLPENSPAFNASNNIDCPEEDQRGLPRNDGQCDIGAFEGDSDQTLEDENFFVIPIKNGKPIIFSL